MLTDSEKKQLIQAVGDWAQTAPDGPVIAFSPSESGEFKTPTQILSDIQNDTEDGRALMVILEHAVRTVGLANAVQRFAEQTNRQNRAMMHG